MQGAGKVAAVAVELLESSQVQAVGLLEWSEPLLSGRLASWLVAWMVALPGAVQAGWPADAGSLVVLLFPVQVPLLVAALVAVQVAVLVPAPEAVLGAVQVAVPVAALVAVPAAVTEVAMVAWTSRKQSPSAFSRKVGTDSTRVRERESMSKVTVLAVSGGDGNSALDLYA